MPKRDVNPKSEYRIQRDAYRKACDRHVVQFESDMPEDMKRKTFALADFIRKAGNHVVAEMNKRIEQMYRRKEYHRLLVGYGKCVDALKSASPDTEHCELPHSVKECGFH